MTQQLREALDRVAEQAPRSRVPGPDLWRRGRRARRRAQAMTVGAVLALVLAVGGLGSLLTLDRTPAPAEREDGPGAVPSYLWPVPQHLTVYDEETERAVWAADSVQRDLAIGQGSAAFTVPAVIGRLPVVVTAADGRYHLLDLPGWAQASGANATFRDGQALALSPDGSQLAYAWWEPPGEEDASLERVPAGVRVVDLDSGELRTITLEADGFLGVLATDLRWSHDSRWLAWQGARVTRWDSQDLRHRGFLAGRIAPGATTTEAVPTSGRREALDVTPDGEVLTARGLGSDLRRPTSMLLSPGQRLAALGTVGARQNAAFTSVADGTTMPRPLGKGLGLYPGGAEVQPLGWLSETLLLARVLPDAAEPDRERRAQPQLVIMTAPSEPESSWTYRIVGGTPPTQHVSDSLSVAVDLMTLAEPTRDFPVPEWPREPIHSAWWIALGAAVALAGGLLLLRRRRRPRP